MPIDTDSASAGGGTVILGMPLIDHWPGSDEIVVYVGIDATTTAALDDAQDGTLRIKANGQLQKTVNNPVVNGGIDDPFIAEFYYSDQGFPPSTIAEAELELFSGKTLSVSAPASAPFDPDGSDFTLNSCSASTESAQPGDSVTIEISYTHDGPQREAAVEPVFSIGETTVKGDIVNLAPGDTATSSATVEMPQVSSTTDLDYGYDLQISPVLPWLDSL